MALAYAAVLVVAMRVRPFEELSHATLAWILLIASLGFLMAALALALAWLRRTDRSASGSGGHERGEPHGEAAGTAASAWRSRFS